MNNESSKVQASVQVEEIITIFQQAVDGLLWMSESDYPFIVQSWEKCTPDEVLTVDVIWNNIPNDVKDSYQLHNNNNNNNNNNSNNIADNNDNDNDNNNNNNGKNKSRNNNSVVECKSIDEFFYRATIDEEWFDDSEREISKRYRHLLSLLQKHISKQQQPQQLVFRIGEIDIDVYIVVEISDAHWLVLSTKVIET